MLQNLAWAVCSNGTTFPTSGLGFTPATMTSPNWAPNIFTGTLGSVWVPDTSVSEHNNALEPLTGGGRDWAFEQSTATCKQTDIGSGGVPPAAWAIPLVNFTDCFTLPVFRGTFVQNFGDLPQKGTALTPTCDPSKLSTLAPNPANTYLNQLGCLIVRQATARCRPPRRKQPRRSCSRPASGFRPGGRQGQRRLVHLLCPDTGTEAGRCHHHPGWPIPARRLVADQRHGLCLP